MAQAGQAAKRVGPAGGWEHGGERHYVERAFTYDAETDTILIGTAAVRRGRPEDSRPRWRRANLFLCSIDRRSMRRPGATNGIIRSRKSRRDLGL